MDQEPETQPIESLSLNEWEINFFPAFHRNIHRCSKVWARTTGNVRRNQASVKIRNITCKGVTSQSSLRPQCPLRSGQSTKQPNLPVIFKSKSVVVLTNCMYEQRARDDGHELDDWLQAESEVTQQKAKTVAA
jgi:hypothetical protein